MKITLRNTPNMGEITVNGNTVGARVWQGETDDGVRVEAFIICIGHDIPPNQPVKKAEFEAELSRFADPRPFISIDTPDLFV